MALQLTPKVAGWRRWYFVEPVSEGLTLGLGGLVIMLALAIPAFATPPSPDNAAGHALGIVPAHGNAGAKQKGGGSNLVYHSGPVLHTNRRSFTLAYDVENEGPSKVVGVVVWYTRDGKSWTSYPEPIKPTKAIPITVVSDGRYQGRRKEVVVMVDRALRRSMLENGGEAAK